MHTNGKTTRVLFWGMGGDFSRIVLSRLLEAGVQVCGVITWKEAAVSLVSTSSTAAYTGSDEAGFNHVPTFTVSNLYAPETRKMVKDLAADVVCVACFPKRIPKRLLDLPSHGFWNVHPSMLPDYRGPVPLFWTFREGVRETAVTIHQMDTQIDTGNILAQTPISLPDGISGSAADQMMAKTGGRSLVKLLDQLQNGNLQPVPQSGKGSHFSYPEAADFHIPTSWSAQRAFNFMRGVAEWKRPFPIYTPQKILIAHQAISFDAQATLHQPFIRQNDMLKIQFSPGVLIVN